MRHLIATVLALTLVAGAHVGAQAVPAAKGDRDIYVLMSGSLRSYETERGTQWDALIDVTEADGKNVGRFRFGVTGCALATPVKLIARVNADGSFASGAPISEWHPRGTRVYDSLAMLVCDAAKKAPRVDQVAAEGVGKKIEVVPSTVRVRAGGTDPIYEALIQQLTNGKLDYRVRYAVSGCALDSKMRMLMLLDGSGNPIKDKSIEWSPQPIQGSEFVVADAIAMKICIAARGQ